MSADYWLLVSQNATKLSKKLQRSILENAHELGLDGRGSASGSGASGGGDLFTENSETKIGEIAKQLDGNIEREKLQALKRLIAYISKGRNVARFFPHVIKNVASSSLQVRKLVYIFLLRYAESEPDLTLLSINTFQRDLNDENPLIRAMALRVLSSIRVSSISSIIAMGIKTCSEDASPYVRKQAALAIPKCFQVNPAHGPALEDLLTSMLADSSAIVLGSVIMAFNEICRDRLDLLHTHYRKLCRVMLDIDEWGQIELLDLLTRYARSNFRDPRRGFSITADHLLLLQSARPLVHSRNTGVILALTRLYHVIGTPGSLTMITGPLLRACHAASEMQELALMTVAQLSLTQPELFSGFAMQFLVLSSDPHAVKRLKVQILCNLVNESNAYVILREFLIYTKSPDRSFVHFVILSIAALHRSSVKGSMIQERVTRSLFHLVRSPRPSVCQAAVLGLEKLARANAAVSGAIILSLLQQYKRLASSKARTVLLTLACESMHEPDVARFIPDLLRLCALDYKEEDKSVKCQILYITALYILHRADTLLPQTVALASYIFEMADWDVEFDVRERARTLRNILGLPTPVNQDNQGDADHKGLPSTNGAIEDRPMLKGMPVAIKRLLLLPVVTSDQLSELSADRNRTIGHQLPLAIGPEPDSLFPPWTETPSDDGIRDPPPEPLPFHRTQGPSTERYDEPRAASPAIATSTAGGETSEPRERGDTDRLSALYHGQARMGPTSSFVKGAWTSAGRLSTKTLDEFLESSEEESEPDEAPPGAHGGATNGHSSLAALGSSQKVWEEDETDEEEEESSDEDSDEEAQGAKEQEDDALIGGSASWRT